MRFRVVAAEAWRSLTASLSTSLAAGMTVLIGMFLVGVLISFWTYADSWSNQKKKQLEVNRQAIRARLEAIPDEIARETEQIRARYANPMPRLFPVAVTFLVPELLVR